MNKNMDQNKSETPILLQKGSLCIAGNFDVYLSILKCKGLKKEDVDADFYSNSDIKYTVPVFYFIKSPDLDGDKEWHYDHHEENERPPYEGVYMMGYRSVHKVNGHNRLVRTSGLMFMVNVHKMESVQFKEFAANIKNYDSKTQIEMLEKAGYKKFTVKLGNRHGAHLSRPQNPLELVDENGKSVYSFSECYTMSTNDKNGRGEYIIMAHNTNPIDRLCCNVGLNSIIVLNKNTEMKYNGDKSPFCEVNNKDPLTFYCEPGSKVAIDILSKFRDEGKYPEFYNATTVFMRDKFVADYQENLDNVDNYRKMKEFIKLYKENEDYFSIKLSDCIDYSNQRIEQLIFAQKKFSDTWEKFVAFMEKIGVKEKSEAKDVESKNDNDKNDENMEAQDYNENKIDVTESSQLGEIDNENNEKDIELISDNKKAKIEEVYNQSEIESELKDKRETLTYASSVVNLNQNTIAVTENLQFGGSKNKNKDNKINNPEEHLCSFMRYLKKHWPRIFKFFNTIRCSFSRFIGRFKNKSNNNGGNSLENAVDEINLKQSLIDKTSNLSSQKDIVNKPDNMENKLVNLALQQK